MTPYQQAFRNKNLGHTTAHRLQLEARVPQESEDASSELMTASTFWCETHLAARPLSEQSPDPRYCQACYAYLLQEAATLPPGKRPAWVPKVVSGGHENALPVPRGSGDVVAKIPTASDGGAGIMQQPVAVRKRGRPPKVGPVCRSTAWRRTRKSGTAGAA